MTAFCRVGIDATFTLHGGIVEPHAIDATQNELNCLDTIYLRERSLYFLKLAIDQITSAAPAQKDAGGTVEE